jgi:hypothetical protein
MIFSNQLGFILKISLVLFMHMLAQTDITMPKNGTANITLDGNILIRLGIGKNTCSSPMMLSHNKLECLALANILVLF